MKLDLTNLENAISSLEIAFQELKKDQNNQFVRDSNIQRFEYTYELAHKTLKRFLELSTESKETIDEMSFPNLIRTAAEKGLVKNSWNVWEVYRKARNSTSHAYNKKLADEVLDIIDEFIIEAKFLYGKVRSELEKL